MSAWVVVGREHSGDEDENVSPVEAFGPFLTWETADNWLGSAPTLEGRGFPLTEDLRWLLDLFGVPLRNPDLTEKEAGAECLGCGSDVWTCSCSDEDYDVGPEGQRRYLPDPTCPAHGREGGGEAKEPGR